MKMSPTLFSMAAVASLSFMVGGAFAQNSYTVQNYKTDPAPPRHKRQRTVNDVHQTQASLFSHEYRLEDTKRQKAEALERQIWKREYGNAIPAGYGTVDPSRLSPEAREALKKQSADMNAAEALKLANRAARQDEAFKIKNMNAADIMRSMSDHLASMQGFKMSLTETREEAGQSGAPVTKRVQQNYVVQRPNKLKLRTVGAGRDSELWFDGNMLTVQNHAKSSYASEDMPGSLDGLVATLQSKESFVVPAALFLSTDIFGSLHANMSRAINRGIQTIKGRKCHHIDGASGDVAWQLYVDAEGDPVPRRLYVDYRADPSRVLRYGADISDLRAVSNVAPETFVFKPVSGLEKSDLRSVATGQYTK